MLVVDNLTPLKKKGFNLIIAEVAQKSMWLHFLVATALNLAAHDATSAR